MARSRLLQAIQEADLDEVRRLATGKRLHAPRRNGGPPLYEAVTAGQPAVVELLLSLGAKPAIAVPPDDDTPLHVAARQGASRVVDLLLDHGAEIDAIARDGKTPFDHAAGHGEPTCRALLERGARPSARSIATAIGAAIRSRRFDLVGYLVDRLLDPDQAGNDGLTTLHVAVVEDHLDTVRLLLDRGADPAAPSEKAIRRWWTAAPTARDPAALELPAGATPLELARALRTRRLDGRQLGDARIVKLLKDRARPGSRS